MIKKSIFILLFFMGFISCKKEIVKEMGNEVIVLVSSVKIYNYNELKPFLEKKDDKIYIVNFWATWCAPCVKELPYFDKIKQEYANKNVEILLVSLDFPKQVEKKLIPFINKNKIESEVVLLDDINEDVWIKAIDETWNGALPATLIYTKNSRKFYKGAFDYKTLESELLSFMN
jgi:thiol-disulfide isomerase/thioredoxin